MNKKGDILFGKIIRINSEGLTVITNKNYIFTIPIKLITDYNWKNIFYEFSLKDKVNFYVEEINHENKTGIGNFKQNHPYYCKKPFSEELKETKHGFSTLKKSIDTEIKNYENRGN
ncbi:MULTISPECIES: RNA-binding protein [unclassified Mycoplasma]|uniref:RNA-binding protein n=1 Tax=unclassified Mycoplasma TaxID=2683645 RepID=UPI00216B3B0B|nr:MULTISPECIES: RNA-binding protein [unclassified Mycoplasma]MCS4537025.1 RNA-binding protein [Mycoplasma sp. CSL7475-4]MCT4469396.1 RNA-binding protein [Mycoplasma sp. HS2188]